MKNLISYAVLLGFLGASAAASAQSEHGGGAGNFHSGPSGGGEHAAPHGGGEQHGGGEHGAPSFARPTESPRSSGSYGSMPREEHAAPAYRSEREDRPAEEQHHGGYESHEHPWHNTEAHHHYNDGGYRAPEGYEHYEHHRWNHGDRLPEAYFARDYWIANFFAFGLFAPPPGEVWVRVGDDALLIDQYSGEVIEVDYGVFD